MQAQDFYSMKKRFCCGCLAVFTKSIYDNTVIDETNLRRTDNTGTDNTGPCLPGVSSNIPHLSDGEIIIIHEE